MRQVLAFAVLLGASPPLLAQNAPAAATTTGGDIVVTGRRLTDTERALAECLARKCPPDEDIDATLAHVENLFVAGEYQRARATSKASLHRNRRHAKAYPVPVSDLERSNGRVSAHLGEKFDYQYSTWGIRRALKAGLPDTDPRLVGANIEIAQMLVTTGRVALGHAKYLEAIRDARKIDRPDLAALGELRLASLSYSYGEKYSSRKTLEAIAASADPRTRVARLVARLLLAQIDRQEGKPDRTDELLAEIRSTGLKQPVLIFAPPYQLTANLASTEVGTKRNYGPEGDAFQKRWIDVGFWVRPDGRVEDVDVLRSSGKLDWIDPLLKSIAGRSYTPIAENGTEGAYRVERYSYTSFWGITTGTRIRQRTPGARVEFLDLTVEPKVAANEAR